MKHPSSRFSSTCKHLIIPTLQIVTSFLFPIAMYLLRAHPLYLILLALVWLTILLPNLNSSKTLHQIFRNRARKVLVRIREIHKQEQGDARVIAYLRKINPFVFEELILLAFKEHGFPVIPNKRYTGDGGIDGQVNVYGSTWPIQAKRYSKHVKKSHVDQFARLINEKSYHGGIFIHTGRTGKEVRDTYRNGTLIILSGSVLVDLFCYPSNHTIHHLLAFRGVKLS